ncbi:MAG: glycosyltransferase family 4 protein [Flavisolibacter sp.]
MKNGIIALYYKWKWRINYIVVEGWSWFLPEERNFLKKRGLVFGYLLRNVLKYASAVITLSEHLGKSIDRHIYPINYKVIPNVVDTTIFYPAREKKQHSVFRFIHISNLAPTKNIEQILLAFSSILKKGYKAELLIHAPESKALKAQIANLELQSNVILRGEASQEVLADSIRSSDALILFSLFETFGNVIIEANACGVPVITSDYPTFFELVEEGINGLIAKGKDAPALARAMILCISNIDNFDSGKISERTSQTYSFRRVGKLFDDIYCRYF